MDKKRNLSEMIGYQDDSVVSRSLIDKKEGTVTVFAFAQNQGLSEHKTPFEAMAYIIDGECEVAIDGKTSNLGAGDFIMLPPNTPHALKAVNNFKMLLIMIKES